MSIASILQKISSATDLGRFVQGGGAPGRVWTSATRVVDESFLFTESRDGEPAVYVRMAVATDLPPGEAERVKLEIRRESNGPEKDEWSVRLTAGPMLVLEKQGGAADMISLYKKIYRSLTRSNPGGKLKTWGLGAAGAAVVIYVSLAVIGAFAGSSSQMQQAYASAPYVAPPPSFQPGPYAGQLPPAAAPAAQEDASLTEKEKKEVAKRGHKIALGSGGKDMLVFSDPHCPFCQRLESSIDEVVKSKSVNPIIVPVGFKEGSREMIASIFCSKDPAAAWKSALATGEQPGKACDAGLKKIDENNKLFAELRLTATPTIISPKGLIVASFATAQELVLLSNN